MLRKTYVKNKKSLKICTTTEKKNWTFVLLKIASFFAD